MKDGLNGYWILGMGRGSSISNPPMSDLQKTGGPQQNKEWLISFQSRWGLHHSRCGLLFCCPFLTQQGCRGHKRAPCHLPLLSCRSFWDVGWRQRIATSMVCAALLPYVVQFVRSHQHLLWDLKMSWRKLFLPKQSDVITNAPHSSCWWCMGATDHWEVFL